MRLSTELGDKKRKQHGTVVQGFIQRALYPEVRDEEALKALCLLDSRELQITYIRNITLFLSIH